MAFVTHHLDEMLIGIFLSSEVLGIYYFGKNMIYRLKDLITAPFTNVLYSLLSKLQKDNIKLASAYIKVSEYISFISFPLFAGVAVTAHLFVPVLFGAEWNDSVIIFQVFSLNAIFLVLTASVSSSLLYSLNKPELVFYIDLITNTIYFITLLVFASKGIIAVLIVYSLYIVYKTSALQYYANLQLLHSLTFYLLKLKMPTILSITMVAGVLLFQYLTNSYINTMVQLVASILLGLLSYLLLSVIFQRSLLVEIKHLILKKNVPVQY